MYIPKNLYRKKQTYGDEVINPDGTDYVGPYIETASGLLLAGNTLSKNSVQLLSKTEENLNRIERPYNDYFGPSEIDYTNGFFIRYFTRARRNGQFVEMNKEQWLEKSKRKGYSGGQVTWELNGPIDDGQVNGVPYKGTSTKNKERLLLLETEFPGIVNFFSNTSEFVR